MGIIMTRAARIVPVTQRTEVLAAMSDGRQLVVLLHLLFQTIHRDRRHCPPSSEMPRPSPAGTAVSSRTHSWRRQVVWLIFPTLVFPVIYFPGVAKHAAAFLLHSI